MSGKHLIVEIVSIVIGAVIGEWIDLDYQMVRLGDGMERLFQKSKRRQLYFQSIRCVQFVFLRRCNGNCWCFTKRSYHESSNSLHAKALIDGVAALIMTTTLGFGVVLSAGMVFFLYEAVISLTAQGISPYLTTEVINEISCIGAIILLGMSFNQMLPK